MRGRFVTSTGPTSWARFAFALAVTIAVILPLALGPACVPFARALGGDAHVCACGMKPGTCGCPECEKLERERLRDLTAHSEPVLRGPCAPDRLAPLAAALPLATPPPASVALPPPARSRQPLARVTRPLLPDPAEPLEPPPKLDRAA